MLQRSTRHGDRGMVKAFGISTAGKQVFYDRDRACGLSHDSHLLGVSAKLGNVLLDPVQSIALVFETQVQKSSLLKFLGRCVSEMCKAVVERSYDNGLTHLQTAFDEVGTLVERSLDDTQLAESRRRGT
jgi:hypothetical protein